MNRREFIIGAAASSALAGCASTKCGDTAAQVLDTRDLDIWQRETDLVQPESYAAYFNGRLPASERSALARLDAAFEKVMAEVRTVQPTEIPAVWLVYNMGVVVKTRESLFSIDLVHRRSEELAPMLDFALITHNHDDHYTPAFYKAMNGAGKTVVNNFIDNYGAADWKKGGSEWYARGGYTRAEKVFEIKDVEIRTSLTDHNPYLVDYTTAFEIRVGSWTMYHSGDCSNVAKLNPTWGRPDLWIVFPGCGIDIAAGQRKLTPRKMAFGHLWELGHETGRLTTPMVRSALQKVRDAGGDVDIPLWGERIV